MLKETTVLLDTILFYFATYLITKTINTPVEGLSSATNVRDSVCPVSDVFPNHFHLEKRLTRDPIQSRVRRFSEPFSFRKTSDTGHDSILLTDRPAH